LLTLQLATVRLQLHDLLLERVHASRDVVEEGDQLALAQLAQAGLVLGPHLGDEGDAQQRGDHGRDDLAGDEPHRGDRPQPPSGLRGGGVGPGVSTDAFQRTPGAGGPRHQAPRRWRRIAATLEKMRSPRTTTTPVDSWAPTPSWLPRKTMSAATTTLDRMEMTNTRSLKIPSSAARVAPNTASRAAITAMGR